MLAHLKRLHFRTFSSLIITSVSPLLSTPVYRGHSGASISFNSRGQSLSSTDSLLPLTWTKLSQGVWGPHSVREIRFWETHLARLSPTLSFSRSWHKTFFVFRHFTAVCYHRLISLWFSRASNGLEAKWSPDTWTLSLRKISERNANYFWKNYLLAWRAFGSNYKTMVKTEWVIITYYINILLPRRKFFTSLSQKTC